MAKAHSAVGLGREAPPQAEVLGTLGFIIRPLSTAGYGRLGQFDFLEEKVRSYPIDEER